MSETPSAAEPVMVAAFALLSMLVDAWTKVRSALAAEIGAGPPS
jgi:hypothetical protein